MLTFWKKNDENSTQSFHIQIMQFIPGFFFYIHSIIIQKVHIHYDRYLKPNASLNMYSHIPSTPYLSVRSFSFNVLSLFCEPAQDPTRHCAFIAAPSILLCCIPPHLLWPRHSQRAMVTYTCGIPFSLGLRFPQCLDWSEALVAHMSWSDVGSPFTAWATWQWHMLSPWCWPWSLHSDDDYHILLWLFFFSFFLDS